MLESVDQVKYRIDEATRYIELDRLAISPQCGFASTAAGNPLTLADERAKLVLIVQVAKIIWSCDIQRSTHGLAPIAD